MIGAMALANRDTKAHHIHVGIPAKPVREKDPSVERRPPTKDPLADGPR
jgi:hypothetical protein